MLILVLKNNVCFYSVDRTPWTTLFYVGYRGHEFTQSKINIEIKNVVFVDDDNDIWYNCFFDQVTFSGPHCFACSTICSWDEPNSILFLFSPKGQTVDSSEKR